MKKAKEYIQKYSSWIIGGLVVIALGVLIWVLWPKTKVEAPITPEVPVIAAPDAVTSRPYRPYLKPKTPVAPAVQPTYLEALHSHAATRIQLDEQCHPTPLSMVIKGGQEIMVDNRASVAREIDFASKKISVPAYGFVFIKTDTVTSNQTILLDCGTQQNVINITIEP